MNLKFRFLTWLYKKIEPWFKKLELTVSQQAQIELGLEKLAAYRKRNPKRYEEYALVKPDYKRHDPKLINKPGYCECDHLKGGRFKLRTHKDYAVFFHRYPDGRPEIKCMICGQPWGPNDSDWQEALEMVAQSTNHPSSSEIVLNSNEVKIERPGTIAVLQDKL